MHAKKILIILPILVVVAVAATTVFAAHQNLHGDSLGKDSLPRKGRLMPSDAAVGAALLFTFENDHTTILNTRVYGDTLSLPFLESQFGQVEIILDNIDTAVVSVTDDLPVTVNSGGISRDAPLLSNQVPTPRR